MPFPKLLQFSSVHQQTAGLCPSAVTTLQGFQTSRPSSVCLCYPSLPPSRIMRNTRSYTHPFRVREFAQMGSREGQYTDSVLKYLWFILFVLPHALAFP